MTLEEARAAGREPGPSCGLFTKDSKSARQDGRDLLNPEMLLYIGLRCEHRQSNVVRYATVSQKLQTTTSDCFLRQLHTLGSMRQFAAAAQGLLGVLRIYNSLLSCYEPTDGSVCGIPRERRIKKDSLYAFLECVAFKTAGRQYPKSTARLLELLKRGTFQGLPTDFVRGRLHPFCEPVRVRDQAALEFSNARQRENPRERRARLSLSLERSLKFFKQWCHHEVYFYKCRVMFWCSSWPSSTMTSKGVHELLEKRQLSVPAAAQSELQVTGAETEEEEIHLDPCSTNPFVPGLPSEVLGVGVDLSTLLEAHETADFEDTEANSDEPEISEREEHNSLQRRPSGLAFQLPCDNDPFLQKLMSDIAVAKAVF